MLGHQGWEGQAGRGSGGVTGWSQTAAPKGRQKEGHHSQRYNHCDFPFFWGGGMLGLFPRATEVLRLGVELATAAGLHHRHSNARSRPGMEPARSWILAGFVTAEPRQELHNRCNLNKDCEEKLSHQTWKIKDYSVCNGTPDSKTSQGSPI